MSWEVVHTASMRLLMLCLLTCVAYLVTFNINTMWTRVLHCDELVYPGFDAVDILSGGSTYKPTEGSS